MKRFTQKYLVDLCAEYDLSLHELTSILGMPYKTACRWANGTTAPKYYFLRAMRACVEHVMAGGELIDFGSFSEFKREYDITSEEFSDLVKIPLSTVKRMEKCESHSLWWRKIVYTYALCKRYNNS